MGQNRRAQLVEGEFDQIEVTENSVLQNHESTMPPVASRLVWPSAFHWRTHPAEQLNRFRLASPEKVRETHGPPKRRCKHGQQPNTIPKIADFSSRCSNVDDVVAAECCARAIDANATPDAIDAAGPTNPGANHAGPVQTGGSGR